MFRTPHVPPFMLSALLAAGSPQQAPHADWRTIQTTHYRIHYPPPLADWAQDVATRVEGIHAAVVKLVGYESPKPVQVLLMDPMEEANGMAVPLMPYPFVMLWRTPPESDEFHAGSMSTWTEDLVSHEFTHIQHLTRPQNHPRIIDRLFELPLGPIATKAPRWVDEGYATLAEGRITGSGRPHSSTRAALLRQWAIQGKLPDYGALSSFRGFQGGNMAYMVGSAYLEWLERQRPEQPDILQKLWKQIASRKRRDFDASFKATFGFTARDGYDRFRAELNHDALEWETRLKAEGLQEGELWLRAGGMIADLAVSPDGTKLLARVSESQTSELRVWDLKPVIKPETQKKTEEKDPQEVEDASPEFPEHRVLFQLPAINFHRPDRAEWVDDGTVKLMIKKADAEGILRRRPALWRLNGDLQLRVAQPPSGHWTLLKPVHCEGSWILEYQGRRVPLPGQAMGRAFVDSAGAWIYAACEWEGTWNLVRVPIQGNGFGAVERLTRTASTVWNPAPSPDGKTLFFTRLDARGVEIRKLDLTPPSGFPSVETPTAPEARILAAHGVISKAPEPDPLPSPVPALPSVPYRATDYLWNQMVVGYTVTPAGESGQVGYGGSDCLGRFSWQTLVGFAQQGGPSGAMAGFSSSAWAWNPSMHMFLDREKPSSQRMEPLPNVDRERRGGEFALTFQDKGEHPYSVSPVLAWERIQWLNGIQEHAERGLAGLRGHAGSRWGRGSWGIGLQGDIQVYQAEDRIHGTSESWNAERGCAALRLDTPWMPFTFKGEGGRIHSSREAFHLGGLTTSLVPQSLDFDRVEQAALPAFHQTGNRFQRWRGEMGKIFKAYVEGTALWNAGAARGSYVRVAGLELDLNEELRALPLPAFGNMTFLLGAHRILDGPLKKRENITLSIVVRP